MAKLMLSTVDNPFDPFTQFDQWLTWDIRCGHNSLGLLDRLLHTSEELSDAEQEERFNDVVNEIVEENVTGVFIAVEEGTPPRTLLAG